MKTPALALAIFGVLSSAAFSQSPAELDLYEQLNGPEAAKALEVVLEKPDERSAFVLFLGAGAAFKEKRLEDSAFLFYAGQLRARFDKECFPPVGQGGDSPFTAISALSYELGAAINPAAMAEPQTFAKAMARIKKWNPKASKEYNPGYEFSERKSEEDALAATKSKRSEFIDRMSDLATLLNDQEYFAAFRVVQAYNFALDDKGPTQDAYDQAMKTMGRIEKEKGLKGVVSK
jgi:hypothetical protein